MHVLDSHVHCGLTLPYRVIKQRWNDGDIEGGVLFSPAEEIYDRFDPSFVDSDFYRNSRQKVHSYLKSLISEKVFAYWFVWTDYELPWEDFVGIKWHRHPDEPRYDYSCQECYRFIKEACMRSLPIIIEEEFENTLYLIKQIDSKTAVIIPHFGMLNGGYMRLKEAGVFENPMVYVDTALASSGSIRDFAGDYGVDRILFGSDFPFGEPAHEKRKVEAIFSGPEKEKVMGKNLLELLDKNITV